MDGSSASRSGTLPLLASISEYFAMGGYAGYVWPAYAVTVIMLVGTLMATLSGLRRREAMVKALEAARPPRRCRPAETADSPAAPPPGEATAP